jgi:uncharacterized protein (DUF342 family)
VCAFHPHDHQKIAVLMHHIAALEDKVAQLEKQLAELRRVSDE